MGQYERVHARSLVAAVDIPVGRFVNRAGGLGGPGVIGVSEHAARTGEVVSVVTGYSAAVQAAEMIAVGDFVDSDALGRAIVARAAGIGVAEGAAQAGFLFEMRCGFGALDPAALVTFERGPGGGVGIPALRGATRDRLADVLPWCIPVHRSVLDPLRHVGMSPVTSGVATLSHNVTASELPGMSFGLAFSGAGTAGVSVQLPPAPSSAIPSQVLVGPRIHARIKCSDWSKVTGFWIDFLVEGSTSKKFRWQFYPTGKSLYGQNDPVYADRWNNQFRTFIADSEYMSASGSPTATWGRTTKYLECTGISFVAITTAAVTFEITRIYCPEWPIGAFVGIFDGWYRPSREFALREFASRGWGCGGSVVRLDGASGEHPTPADIAPLIAANFDVFMHGHDIEGGSIVPMSAQTTQTSMLSNHAAHRRALASLSPHMARGLRWHQWFQNNGSYAGSDMAGELKRLGINAGRGFCSDAEWGINPNNDTTTLSDERRWQSWANYRGRFNRKPLGFYTGMAEGAGYFDATNTGDATYPTLRDRIEYAAKNSEPVMAYTHRITDVPSSLDTTTIFARDLVADLAAKEKEGSLLMLSPTDVEYLTYWRRGEVFMRWDGEWVYRHDPTRIAF